MPPAGQSKGSSPRSRRVFLSNLQSFFAHTAPGVHLSQTAPNVSTLQLSELWESLEDASAFGVEVPIKEDWQDEGVTQVYAPYLSALQIFRAPRLTDRLKGYGSDEESSAELTASEESSACSSASSVTQEAEEDSKRILPPYTELSRARAGLQQSLLFEHFERSSPHSRPPLTDQIRQLAEEDCPQLLTLNSSELHPYSWLAIAWYPVYRIPAGRTLHDVSACFLTYHSLSAPQPPHMGPLPPPMSPIKPCGGMQPAGARLGRDFGRPASQDVGLDSKAAGQQLQQQQRACAPVPPSPSKGAAAVLSDRQLRGAQPQAFLMPFGFVPCKAVGRTWTDRQNAAVHAALLCAALTWTRQLGVLHPDQAFFTRHLGNSQWDTLS